MLSVSILEVKTQSNPPLDYLKMNLSGDTCVFKRGACLLWSLKGLDAGHQISLPAPEISSRHDICERGCSVSSLPTGFLVFILWYQYFYIFVLTKNLRLPLVVSFPSNDQSTQTTGCEIDFKTSRPLRTFPWTTPTSGLLGRLCVFQPGCFTFRH